MPGDDSVQQRRLLTDWNLNQEGRGHYGSLANYFGVVVRGRNLLSGKPFQSWLEVASNALRDKGSDTSEPFFFMLKTSIVCKALSE